MPGAHGIDRHQIALRQFQHLIQRMFAGVVAAIADDDDDAARLLGLAT